MAGRPRNPAADAAILSAALSVLRERGLAGLTLDEVSRRAGVGKSSLYARFRGRAQLAAAAVASLQREPPPATGELRDDLIAYLRAVERDLGALGNEVLGSVLGHGPVGSEDRRWPIEPLARHGRRLLARARERGQLAPESDIGAAAALLTGSLLVRRLLGENRDTPWSERIVDFLLAGLRG